MPRLLIARFIGTDFRACKQSSRFRSGRCRPPRTAWRAPKQTVSGLDMTDTQRPVIELLIAAPRGFCAGVDRAIQIVELAIEKHGAPVYVRHEIVHNKFVVDSLRAKGAVFVEELDQVPDGVPVVFSAHGVPKSVPAAASQRGLEYLDATCPLVSKVHRQAERLVASGRHILFVGHAGHPEVIGTFGQVPEGQMTLIETVEDVAALQPADPDNLAFLTQTTLSVDDTRAIVEATIARFPTIVAPKADDICYATSNRQNAVKAIAQSCDMMLVIGAPNSSNSVRLVEVAEREGTRARLIQRAAELDFAWLEGVGTLGITAGASAPEVLVRELVHRIAERYDVTEREVEMTRETIAFKLPRGLEAA
ncbi:4-hydroxy-3-methylbut-2-enyl diphosphate reductase [Nostoc sp. 3335mG]|nr:4-hydroxy-3-methylbut-2-enyl diphosphate reductase [Nostoc sp. 3335mG]